jgi:tetratricopeptide (TPR) repeat protein
VLSYRIAKIFWIVCVFALGTFAKQDFFVQGNQLYDQGKFLEAVKYYRAAIQNGQMEPYAWFNLGNSLVQLGKNNLAIVAYKRSTELAPKFVRPWVLLGDLYFIHGDIGKAIASFNRARRLGDESEHVHFALAECYRKGRAYTAAQREYETVLKLNPDRMDCWFALAEIYEKIEDYSEAIRVLRRALQLTVTAGADVQFYLAYLYLQLDSVPQGIGALEEGLMLNPGNLMARRHLAVLYQQQNSPWLAIFTLEQGILQKTLAQSRDIEVDLGQIYFDQKRYSEALDHFIKAWKGGSSQGRIGAENVGNTWFNLGDTLQSQIAYRRVRMKE